MLPENMFPPAWDLPLQPLDLESLEQAIVQCFTDTGMTRLLLYKAGWDWNKYTAPGSFEDRVFLLIQRLRDVGQLHYLIDLVDAKCLGHPILSVLRDRVAPPLPPRAITGPADVPAEPIATGTGNPDDVADPWQVVLLDTDQPFLDRADLRNDCRSVGMGNNRRILNVTGESDTGKSYTARYLDGVYKCLGEHDRPFITQTIHLDRLNGVVESGSAVEIEGLRLARRLSLALTDEPLPSHINDTVGSEQEVTWAADAAYWIVSKAKRDPLRWLILDGFKGTVLSPNAQALITSVLNEVTGAASNVRVALLGYPGNLSWLESKESKVRHVELEMEEFSDEKKLSTHVINYLLEVRKAAVRRDRPPFTDDELDAAARRVLSSVDAAALDLAALETSLTDIAEGVLVGTG